MQERIESHLKSLCALAEIVVVANDFAVVLPSKGEENGNTVNLQLFFHGSEPSGVK